MDAAKAGGRKPRKTPATTKAALLEALGREGTVGGAGAPGFQEPRKKSLEQAMRVFTDEFVQEVGALPIRVVVR
ncbi:MAG: hypothetical protein M5U09_13535 [Gammaproteobacteria bacterium]|nr:hypothetical protein [Gammaproteobacteria bacterium]